MGQCLNSGEVPPAMDAAKVLQKTPLKITMTPQQLARLALEFTFLRFPQAIPINNEGDLTQYFYVICSGRVAVKYTTFAIDRGESMSEEVLCTMTEGGSFGPTIPELLEERKEQYSKVVIQPLTDVVCMRIGRSMLQRHSNRYPDIKPALQAAYSLQAILQSVPWLRAVPLDKTFLLRYLFEYETVEPGVRLFAEGSMGRDLYFIAYGEFTVSSLAQRPPNSGQLSPEGKEPPEHEKHPEKDQALLNEKDIDSETRARNSTVSGSIEGEQVLHTLAQGDYFGEIGLALGMPRTADVTAIRPGLVLKLTKDNCDKFFSFVPEFQPVFNLMVKKRAAENFRKYKVPFFAAIPPDKYELLATLCKIKKFRTGDTVFTQGSSGSTFYIIAHGTVRIKMENEEGKSADIGTMGPGQYFGEIALVKEMKRSATIICDSLCVLLTITKQNFEKFIASVPEAAADFQMKLGRYEISIENLLKHPLGHKYFAKHLRREFSKENIEFIEAVEEYHSIALSQEEKHDEMIAFAEDMKKRYFTESSPKELNVSDETKQELLGNIEMGTLTARTFDRARTSIVALMEADSFQRFKQTDLFQEFLKSVKSYDQRTMEDVYQEQKRRATYAPSPL